MDGFEGTPNGNLSKAISISRRTNTKDLPTQSASAISFSLNSWSLDFETHLV